MKNLTTTARAVSIQLFLLLLLGATIFNFAKPASAQSHVSDEVKHDTPGQTIKPSQALHIDVNLALVNVTVTDPYSRIVTGLDPLSYGVDGLRAALIGTSHFGMLLDAAVLGAFAVGLLFLGAWRFSNIEI